MLKTEDLHFGYKRGAPEVLKGVSIALAAGEIGIVLGRNGSGKTTLFKNILGIEKPSSGLITIDGKPVSRMNGRERARLIAYVPQNITFGALTVFDSVLMGRISYFNLRAGKDDYTAVEEILDEMGLSELAGRNVDELSGGEKQKVAIARAIAQAPKVIVFDEPTGNLDIANERLLICETEKLAREKNIAVLCALHDLNEALRLGDRFFFLKDGTVRRTGGKETFTPEVLREIYDIDVRIIEYEGQKIILGGN